jgi:hypothetical protein
MTWAPSSLAGIGLANIAPAPVHRKRRPFDGVDAVRHSGGMSEELRERAEQRLAAAIAAAGVADPRPALRERLRALRERAPAAFDRARSFYEEQVLPALADAAGHTAALITWVEYADFVAGLEGEARLYVVDANGRADAFAGSLDAGMLVLHVPDDAAVPALAVIAPLEPSPAQRATLDLLVAGRVTL